MCRACAGLEIWAKKRVKKGEVAAAAHQPSADSLWIDLVGLRPAQAFAQSLKALKMHMMVIRQ